MRKVISLFVVVLVGIFLCGMGSAELAHNDSDVIYQCGEINDSGTYTLNQSIENVGDCLRINNDSITINGNGFNITGNINGSGMGVDGDGYGDRAWTNLSLNNINITGDVKLVGQSGDFGGAGGSLILTNSHIYVVSTEGGSSNCAGADGGSVTLINSTTTSIVASGSDGYDGSFGGNVNLINSLATYIITTAGNSHSGHFVSGGNVSLIDSNVTSITASGLNGGFVNLINSNVAENITTTGGDGSGGGIGGNVSLFNSNSMAIIVKGLDIVNSGSAGSVTLTNSTATLVIANGGQGGDYTYTYGGNVDLFNSEVILITTTGGSGGSVTLTNSTAINITTTGGIGGMGGISGSVFLNNSNISSIITSGADEWVAAGEAGHVVLINSTATSIITTGGGSSSDPKEGGSVTLINSTATSIITTGGSSYSDGANAGNVNVVGQSSSFYSSVIFMNTLGGSGHDDSYPSGINGNLSLESFDGGIFFNGEVCNDNVCSPTSTDGVWVLNSAGNFSFDGQSPVVHLFPVDNSIETNRTFTYNVSDFSNISGCYLYIDTELKSQNITPVNESKDNVIYFSPLGVGTYTSYISCTDQFGNVGNSSNVTFNVIAEETETTQTSSGGGSRYSLSNEVLENGFSRNVGSSFVWRFNAGNENHTITFNDIYTDSLVFTIASTPRIFTVKINESILIDVEEDGSYDLNITYNKYYGRLANVGIKAVSVKYGEEAIESGETEVEVVVESEGNAKWVFYIINVFLIIVLVVIIGRRSRRVKTSVVKSKKK